MLKHLVIDDIFSDPDAVVARSKKFHFYSSEEENPKKPPDYWKGYRSDLLHETDNQFYNNTLNEIFCKIFDIRLYGSNVDFAYSTHSYFHYLTSNNIQNDSWIHNDPSLFSAVVYLSKNPIPNSGTMFYDEEKRLSNVVENRYNRLVMYNGRHFHSAQSGFGDNLDNSRLTLVFFMFNFMITLK